MYKSARLIDTFVKGLYSSWKNTRHDGQCKMDISEWIEHLTLNVMYKTIAGKRYFGRKIDDEEKRIGKIIDRGHYVCRRQPCCF